MSHGDKVTRLPPGFAPIAQSAASPFAAITDESRTSTACSSIPR